MDNSIITWILAHGHKVLIWAQFVIVVVLWITADPNPAELLAELQQCIEGARG